MMMINKLQHWLVAHLLFLSHYGNTLSVAQIVVGLAPDDDPLVRVVVEFESIEQQEAYWTAAEGTVFAADRSPEAVATRQSYNFQRGSAMAVTLPASQLSELEADPRISSIANDTLVYWTQQGGEEVVPYGIAAIQANSQAIPLPLYPDGDCDDPNSFKICVVDSGLLINHDDIPFVRGNSARGETFGLPDGIDWFNPSAASSHGTHVAGTIIAQANNGIGVVGVIGQPDGICMMTARVFDASGVTSASFIVQAVEWCANEGARVVNLSLGAESTSDSFEALSNIYTKIVDDEGVMVVAAAGNSGSDALSYPASLPAVISVGATNRDNERARFSQFNEQVDLVAPGQDVLSTIISNALLLTSPNLLVESSLMLFSPFLPEDLQRLPLGLVDCGSGFNICQDATGRACIIERGDSFFWEKTLNCQEGGGVVALIFNNEPDEFGGTLSNEDVGVRIPAYAIPREGGFLLLQELESTVILQRSAPAYAFYNGTSMSTPHVTGVAAKIWATRPGCTNVQIREALEQSALDLGPNGRDDEYGHGLVQAEAAYQYLVDTFESPCGGILQVEEVPPSTPTCVETFATCSTNVDCCTGRCALVRINEPRICRTVPKTSKNKLSGGNRGRSGGFRNRQRRTEQNRSSTRRIRGKEVMNQPKDDIIEAI